MTDIDDILGDSDDAWYFPDDDDYERVAEGIYPAHIVELDIVKNKTMRKSGNTADIYKPLYQVAEESASHVGRKVKSSGIFRFKSTDPALGGNRQSTSGNRTYRSFLDVIGVEPEESKDPNTGAVKYRLPSVTGEDAYGAPVMIRVKHREYDAGGEVRISVEASLMYAWGDGKRLEEKENIPF